jgi:hypothetical protein
MPEPTLAIRFQEFQAEVGEYLGWGKGVNYGDKPWTRDKLNRITSCVKSGLRRFYYPPLLPQKNAQYAWSFLKPVANIAFPSGGQWVYLPDDFGQPEGQITITSLQTQTPWPLKLTGIGEILQAYQVDPTITGRPMRAAVTPTRGTRPDGGQQWQLWIYPLADQAYTFQLQYYINPDYLTGDLPYAYGGPEHHETILEACLSIAEERLDDMPAGQGPHYGAFMERLKASIAMDSRLKAQYIGRNIDRSDADGTFDRTLLHWLIAGGVTYGGNPIG